MKRAAFLCVMSLTLAGCSLVPSSVGSDSGYRGAQEPASQAPSSVGISGPRINSAPSRAARPADAQCFASLDSAGAHFEALPDRYLGNGCSTLGAVQLHALQGDTGQLDVSNLGPVACPVSTAFAAWVRFGVDRAARQIFGSPLASIQTMGSFACRNVAGTGRRSAHANAAAIDIGGFILADGRRISVERGWNGSAQERAFLRAAQRSACRRFKTVLGPDYNAAHRDHFHVEGVIDGSSFCR